MNNTPKRQILIQVEKDLKEKMVFLGGPRQVGKTTLARHFVKNESQYLNWDLPTDKAKILRNQIDLSQKLIVLDEVHKYAKWRTLVKGYFDKYYPKLNFLVTGSARLDHLRKGGDSLVGRYHYHRLHPFSLLEISKRPTLRDVEMLLKFGGFPEPLFKQNEIQHQRWQFERIARVTTQDLRDLESVKEISKVELLVHALNSRIAQPLSIKNLQEDLEVSPNTVDRWLGLLETIYYCFRVVPYGPAKVKAVKKTPKLYLWDWSEVESVGGRFENLVASQLLKFCHHQEDTLGLKTELRYFKDVVTLREIDFIVLQKGKPLFAVECKTGDRQLSLALAKNGKRLQIPKLYQVHLGSKDYGSEAEGRVLPFHTFCQELDMP